MSALAIVAIPISVLSIGFSHAVYDETYYGELPYMFNRLKNTKGRKIVFVGNSAAAFSVRRDLLEEELGMPVVLFGLYGAIGTKTMMDLSKANIKKDDIVILMPELTEQGLSMYFSAENTWMAIDGHYNIFNYLAKDNKESMVGEFAHFSANKLSYLQKKSKPSVDGVYMQKSFNIDDEEVGYMTYNREYNTMLYGYDPNSVIKFDSSLFDSRFIDYVNDYSKFVHEKGASLYYGFHPMNNMAVESSDEEIISYYEFLKNNIKCPILGNPKSYIFDYEWFYDSNVHLNSLGTYSYNKQVCDDIKIVLDDISKTDIDIPAKPIIPIEEFDDGDNTDEGLFEYERFSTGYRIIGINEEGKKKDKIIIPSTHLDYPVVTFLTEIFTNNTEIREIIIPSNIRSLNDSCFAGDANLIRIVLTHDDPNKVNVGMDLLDGAENCNIYVKESAYDSFVTHYNWSFYRDKIRKY